MSYPGQKMCHRSYYTFINRASSNAHGILWYSLWWALGPTRLSPPIWALGGSQSGPWMDLKPGPAWNSIFKNVDPGWNLNWAVHGTQPGPCMGLSLGPAWNSTCALDGINLSPHWAGAKRAGGWAGEQGAGGRSLRGLDRWVRDGRALGQADGSQAGGGRQARWTKGQSVLKCPWLTKYSSPNTLSSPSYN